jgi:hypothetical protein
MNETKQQHSWVAFLKFFSEQNAGRRTRLGVFEGGDDFWLESGREFTGIDIDPRTELPTVEVYFGDFTHNVDDVINIKAVYTHAGDEDGLDITDNVGKTTILRFEG